MKYRIIQVAYEETQGMKYKFLLQRKRILFQGWTTIDTAYTLGEAIYYLAKRDPNYQPKKEDILYETGQ